MSTAPQFLLGSGCIKGVLQFGLKGLKLFTQVPLEFLSLVPGQFLWIEVLLQLRHLSLQLPHLFQSVVLLANLVFTPVNQRYQWRTGRCKVGTILGLWWYDIGKTENKTRKLTASFNENKMLRVIILVLDKFLLATDLTYMSNIPNWLCFINAN